ncbi:serine hydrolase domain-containing protein [Tenacibaculum maritimum]|uniref:serine hydrolase domain-containing protein n=1 Tax=Tenacibaculum maritimum TaxID=107401 RepID=UPI00387755DF
MKSTKLILFIIFILLITTIYYNYSKLNIIAGYSAKNMSSAVFLAGRNANFTDETDHNFFPINLAKDVVNNTEKQVTTTAIGLLKRKAVYREGIGSVLAIDGVSTEKPVLVPTRSLPNNTIPYPYGNATPKDSIFSNIDYTKLNEAISFLFNPIHKTRAALVVYKDHIIAERYADNFNKDSKLLGWSMTKSITSTLFGILQHQGKINICDTAPIDAWKNDKRQHITIHNLLQMNSGLEWTEDYNSISDVTKMLFLEPDMSRSQINKPLIGKPNQTWNYSSGTTNLLSGILRKILGSHQTYLNYWYEALIDKIGMNSMVIETDLSGNYVGSSYAWATPRDWSKLGLLYLHNGTWNSENLFDKEWVNYATTPTPTSNGRYGAQIWLNTKGHYPDIPKNTYSFNGYQGQNVFILPDQEMVVVRMGLTKNANMNLFLKNIIASIKN